MESLSHYINLISLPKELFYYILFNLSFNDVIRCCSINSYTAAIYIDRHFWSQKAFIDLNISTSEFNEINVNAKDRYIQLDTNIFNRNLKIAAIKNNLNLIQNLSNKGANINAAFKGVGISGNQKLFDELVGLYPLMKCISKTFYNAIKNQHIWFIKYITTKYNKYIYSFKKLCYITCNKNKSIEILEYVIKNFDGVFDKNLIQGLINEAAKSDNIVTLNYLLSIVNNKFSEINLDIVIGAAAGGHLGLINEYINNADPYFINSLVKFAIESAAEKGHLYIIEYLLLKYSELNTLKTMNGILLHGAIGGYLHIVQYALDHNANYLELAFHRAVSNQKLNIIKFLCEIRQFDKDYFRKLLIELAHKEYINIEVFKFLINYEIEFIKDFVTTMYNYSKNFHIIKYLINIRLINPRFMLHAITNSTMNENCFYGGLLGGIVDVISFLIDNGANNGKSLYKFIKLAIKNNRLIVIEYLLSKCHTIPPFNIIFRDFDYDNFALVKNTEFINEDVAVNKYISYIQDNPMVKVLLYNEFSDKLKINDIIEFKPYNLSISMNDNYLVPLRIILSTDKNKNKYKYITILRYDEITNKTYPINF